MIIDKIDFKQIFLGKHFGIGLAPRDGGDKSHVRFVFLMGKNNWFVSTMDGASAYWMPDIIQQMQLAQEWCERNCDPDYGVGEEGKGCSREKTYGWRFRE